MTDTSITQFSTKMIVTEVTDVQVTEVVDDNGSYVRAIRIYGTPVGQGIGPVLEVQIKSDTEANLKITTPEIDF